MHLEFRSLPVGQLCFPPILFDQRSADCGGLPEPLMPIIVYQSGDVMTVVDGCKRLLQAQRSGRETCDCGVLIPPPDDRRAGLLRISLNRGRTLQFREKYLFVRWLKEHCEEREYAEACTLLSFGNRERFEFERLAGCGGAVVDAVASGALEACFAPEVERFDPSDREAILDLLHRYAFSRQMQRELFDWLPECAFREKCTIPDLLAAPWLQEIERNGKLNQPQKIKHLRTALFNRRFPTLARAKAVWNEYAAKCNPDPGRVAFKPSDAFEKNRLEVTISISSADQARHIFNGLAGISEQQWDRLIYPAQLSGNAGEKR